MDFFIVWVMELSQAIQVFYPDPLMWERKQSLINAVLIWTVENFGVHFVDKDENYSQITAADLSPEEEIYNIIGDDYYELNVDNVEEYPDINIIQPHTTDTPSSGVQPSPEDYLNPVSRIDLETETSDPV